MEVLTPRNIYFILVCCLLITSHCSYAMERIHDGQEPQCYSRFDYEYKVIQKLVQLEEWKKELSETVEAQRETTAAQEAEIKSLSDKLGASDQSLKETISSQKELRETTKTQRETITAQEAEIKSLFDKLGESDQSLKETISSLEDAKTKINEMSRNRGNNNMTGTHVGFTVKNPKDNTDPRIFRTVVYNSEPGFNTATGQFVCQHPGMYIFTATVIREPGPSEASCFIKVNGSGKIRVLANNYNAPNKGYPSGSATLVIHLNAGDEVYLSFCSGTYMYSSSSFSGVLIQPDAN